MLGDGSALEASALGDGSPLEASARAQEDGSALQGENLGKMRQLNCCVLPSLPHSVLGESRTIEIII